MTAEEMDKLSQEQTEEMMAACAEIYPILHGRDPAVQSAIVADLLSMFLAGFPDFAREEVLEQHLDLVRKLVPVNENILYNGGKHPQSQSGQAH